LTVLCSGSYNSDRRGNWVFPGAPKTPGHLTAFDAHDAAPIALAAILINLQVPARWNEWRRPQEREMLKATQLRPGMIIVHEGDLYSVHSVDHRTPGNKRGAMATRMRNLRSGSTIDYRFRAEDFVERAVLDEVEFQYLYSDGEGYHFMNTESFEQLSVSGEVLGDAVNYLIPNLVLKLEFYEGKPIGALLPDTVDLTVVDTEPTVQKATASAVMKPAKLETGLTIQVPPFISNGDKVKVDTSEARYVQRAQ
jgi:elongation factor P